MEATYKREFKRIFVHCCEWNEKKKEYVKKGELLRETETLATIQFRGYTFYLLNYINHDFKDQHGNISNKNITCAITGKKVFYDGSKIDWHRLDLTVARFEDYIKEKWEDYLKYVKKYPMPTKGIPVKMLPVPFYLKSQETTPIWLF